MFRPRCLPLRLVCFSFFVYIYILEYIHTHSPLAWYGHDLGRTTQTRRDDKNSSIEDPLKLKNLTAQGVVVLRVAIRVSDASNLLKHAIAVGRAEKRLQGVGLGARCDKYGVITKRDTGEVIDKKSAWLQSSTDASRAVHSRKGRRT